MVISYEQLVNNSENPSSLLRDTTTEYPSKGQSMIPSIDQSICPTQNPSEK